MTLGDGKTVAYFSEGNGRGGFQFLRGHTSAAELPGERHGKTSGVRGGQQLFGIGADSIFKTSAEGILSLLQHTAVGGQSTFAVLESAGPHCRCFAIHKRLFSFFRVITLMLEIRFWAIEEGYIERSKMSRSGFDGS